MTPADRFKAWLESLSIAWRELVKGWLSSAIGFGIEVFMNVLARSAAPKLKPLIDRLEAEVTIPPELKPIIDEIKTPTGEFAALSATSLMQSLVGKGLGRFLDYITRILNYGMAEVPGYFLHEPAQLLELLKRQKITSTQYYELMKWHGFSHEGADHIWELSFALFPSDIVAPYWLRDKVKGEPFWDDVKKLGVTPEKILVLKEMAYRVPGVQDIIRYVVKEAYSPEVYKKFGQDLEYPAIAEADAEKTGVRPDHLFREWLAHWELPGISQGFEMLHRGVIDLDTLKILLKARDVMPYWRDKLLAISYTPYTRIDARRMWDMRVLNDEELKRSYLDVGYDDEHADKMVLWTKLFVTYPQLVARYKNGWINSDQVLAELIALGLSEERAAELFQTKFKNEAADRTREERDLTAADILSGVKKGVISRAQGLDLLKDMGYDSFEAAFKLAVGAPLDETDTQVKARELTKSDILAGLKSKTITETQARGELTRLRYLPADVDFILKVYQDSIKPPTPEKLLEATRTDITKAVTQGLVTPEQAYELLLMLGYSEAAAAFIIALVPEEDTPELAARRRELAKAEILLGLKTGVLSEQEALARLRALDYSDADANFIYNTFLATISPVPVPPQKEVTKASIVNIVKRGLVTTEQAYQLLIDAGFSDEAASFIFQIEAEASPFSPMSYEEFKQRTGLYRQSQGLETDPIIPGVLEMKARLAQAELEGKSVQTEQLRLNIDTVRRKRRKRLITRQQELQQLIELGVPPDYAKDMTENDDARLAPPLETKTTG